VSIGFNHDEGDHDVRITLSRMQAVWSSMDSKDPRQAQGMPEMQGPELGNIWGTTPLEMSELRS
jgi:hypothetical protein